MDRNTQVTQEGSGGALINWILEVPQNYQPLQKLLKQTQLQGSEEEAITHHQLINMLRTWIH